MNELIDTAAEQCLTELSRLNRCLVLAESCTGGLLASSLIRIPGASAVVAGSAVTYQPSTKHAWLGVDWEDLRREDAVNEEVARSMAAGALDRTPHADTSLAVTGHLGPDAPGHLDGCCWFAVGLRRQDLITLRTHREQVNRDSEDIGPSAPTAASRIRLRHIRRQRATLAGLRLLTEHLTAEFDAMPGRSDNKQA